MITVSLETAKKMKSAWRGKTTIFLFINENKEASYYDDGRSRSKDCFVTYAPTAQEILDELPIYIDTKSNEYGEIVLSIEGSATRRACFYSDIKRQCNYMDMYFVWDTLVEAVAQMYIFLSTNWCINAKKD